MSDIIINKWWEISKCHELWGHSQNTCTSTRKDPERIWSSCLTSYSMSYYPELYTYSMSWIQLSRVVTVHGCVPDHSSQADVLLCGPMQITWRQSSRVQGLHEGLLAAWPQQLKVAQRAGLWTWSCCLFCYCLHTVIFDPVVNLTPALLVEGLTHLHLWTVPVPVSDTCCWDQSVNIYLQ